MTHFRLIPRLSGWRLRILIVLSAVVGAMFALQQATVETLDAAKPPLYDYRGRTGPYLGHLDGTRWITDETTDAFQPGDSIAWRTDSSVQPGVIVSADFELSCNGHPMGGVDYRAAATANHDGWHVSGYVLPKTVPDGNCEIDPSATFTSPDGRIEGPIAFPPIRFTVRGHG